MAFLKSSQNKYLDIFADWFKGIELVGGLFSISLDYSVLMILCIEWSFCSAYDLTNILQCNIFLCSIDRKYC